MVFVSYFLNFLWSLFLIFPPFYGLKFSQNFPIKKSFGNSIVTSGYILGLGLGLRSSQLKTFFSANSGILIGDLEGFKIFVCCHATL